MRQFLTFALLAVVMVSSAYSFTPETVSVKAGKQAVAKRSKLKIKFVSVVEDSRCPVGAQCVWAGNARIKVEISVPKGEKKTFEINTETGPKGDQIGGYAVTLDSLTPYPNASKPTDPKKYAAKFTIIRLQR